MLIDSHLHLDSPEFNEDRSAVLERAKQAGILKVISAGTNLASSESVLTLAAVHPEIYPAVGIHPHEAFQVNEKVLTALHELAKAPQAIAIGEIGLDYYYNFSVPEIQRTVFRRQIRLAKECNLPLIIHCREAFGDLINILHEEEAGKRGGVIHCFTGNWDSAERLLDMGFYIGITGIVTFKNITNIPEVVKRLPLEKMLVETDAPYLAPYPHRGKRNEPSFLIHTVESIAKIKGVPIDEIIKTTTHNTERLFKLSPRHQSNS